MTLPLACIMCSIDPQTTSLLLPIAQATIISAPILMRKQLVDGVRRITGRTPTAGDEDVDDDEESSDPSTDQP
jgi:hypothetical protein